MGSTESGLPPKAHDPKHVQAEDSINGWADWNVDGYHTATVYNNGTFEVEVDDLNGNTLTVTIDADMFDAMLAWREAHRV